MSNKDLKKGIAIQAKADAEKIEKLAKGLTAHKEVLTHLQSGQTEIRVAKPVYSSAQMNEEEAKQVCTWKYPGELAIYNFSDWEKCKERGWDIAYASQRENTYFSAFKDGEYFAFFHIMDRGDHIELGVGMKPGKCGKHNGLPLMKLAVERIRELYPEKIIRLSVLTFNKRAVACYESAGFRILKKYYDAEAFNPGERFLMEYRKDNGMEGDAVKKADVK